MNQLYFEGTIINLYSVDYQYLQDSLSGEMAKLIEMLVSGGARSCIARGFEAKVSTNSTTKILIDQTGLTGIVVSASGLIIQSASNIDGVSLSDYTLGTVNYIYCRCYQASASYNKLTGVTEEIAKIVDESNYTTVYDRKIDTFAIVVYTAAEYNNLTLDEKKELVFLGSTTAQGAGLPLLSVDLSGVTYITIGIADNSISIDKINPSVRIPQRMIYNTSTGDISDSYYNSPPGVDVKDDLNHIRTMIKDVKQTTNWDDAIVSVSGSTPEMNSLFKQGVFPDYLSEYDIVITSSGSAVSIQPGSALIGDIIKEIITSTGLLLPLHTNPLPRIDSIILTSVGIVILEGTNSTNPEPVYYTSTGFLSLYYIYRPGSVGVITSSRIIDNRIYRLSIREVTEIQSTDLTSYDSLGNFHPLHYYAIHKLAVVHTSSGLLVQKGTDFDISTKHGYDNVFSLDSLGTLQTIIHTQEDDELYIEYFPTSIGTTALNILYSTSTGIIDTSTGIIINPIDYLQTNTLVYPLVKGFSDGYHKLQIHTSTGIDFTKLIIGKLDTYYNKDNSNSYTQNLRSDIITTTDLTITGLLSSDENILHAINVDKLDGAEPSTDVTLYNNSDLLIPTQKAFKTWIEDYVPTTTIEINTAYNEDYNTFSITGTTPTTVTINNRNPQVIQYAFTTNTTWNVNIARAIAGSAGTINSSLVYAGVTTSTINLNSTEKFNGYSWTTNLSWNIVGAAKKNVGSFGIQNAAIIMGGYNGTLYYNSTEIFNGSSWTTSGNIAALKAFMAGTGTQNAGQCIGGSTGSVTGVVETFNGSTWTTASGTVTARSDLGASGIQNGSVAFGGWTGAVSAVTEKNLNINSGVWLTVGALNVARYAQAGCGTQHSTLAFDGFTTVAYSITEKFDGYIWRYFGANQNTTRYVNGCCGSTEAAVSFGGLNAAGTYLTSTEKFIGVITNQISAYLLTSTGALYAEESNSFCQDPAYTVLVYPPATFEISTVPQPWQTQNEYTELKALGRDNLDNSGFWYTDASWNLNTARYYLAGAGTQNAGLSFGGTTTGSDYLANTEKFDGSSWIASGDLSNPRRALAGCGIQNAALSFGGYAVTYSAATETFNGSVWANIATPGGVARQYLAGCGSQLAALRFGGDTGVYSAVTEKFNGTSWSATGNLNIILMGLAGCGTQSAALSFGGNTALASAVTEKFDGSVWSYSGNLNIARWFLAGAGTQNAGLSFGGYTTGSYLAITEKFNGSFWLTTRSLNTVKGNLAGTGTQSSTLSFGGFIAAISATTEKFNKINYTTYTGYWTTTSNLNTPRQAVAGCGIQSAALSFGGTTGSNSAVTEKFDGSVWATSGNLVTARAGLMGCGVQNAALSGFGIITIQVNNTEIFNGVSNTWANVGTPGGTARWAVSGCGFVNAAMSFGGITNVPTVLATSEKFSGATWATASALSVARYGLGGCGNTNAALAFGGNTTYPAVTVSAVTDKYNGTVWAASTNLNIARCMLTGSGIQNAGLAIGGLTTVTLAVIEKFNGSYWSASPSWSLTTARYYLASAGVQSSALSFGGTTTGADYSAVTEKFNTILDNYIYINRSAWTIVSTLNTARQQLAGAGIQSAALSFGGNTGSYSAVTEKFDGSSWTTSGNLNTTRTMLAGAGIQAAGLSFGGDSGSYSAVTEKFNGLIWTNSNNLNTARQELAGCGIQTAALSFGGTTGSTSAVTEKFDGLIWSVAGSLNTARYALAGAGSQSAGLSFGGSTGSASIVTETFNGSVWSTSGNLNTGRYALAGCGIQTAALSFGGTTGSTSAVTEKFDGLIWSVAGSLNTARFYLAGAGIQSAGLSFGGSVSGAAAITEMYNSPTTLIDITQETSWFVTGSLNTTRYALAGAGAQNSGLSFGGDTGAYSTVTEKFDGSVWTTNAAWNLNTARGQLGGCGTQTASLSFGGDTGAYSTVTEKFDGSVWTTNAAWNLNTARAALGSAGVQSAAVNFGGTTGSNSAVTEKFNGVTWTSGYTGLTARQGLAGCGIQNAGLSFGGWIGSYLATTEKFNGSVWTTSGNLNTVKAFLSGCGSQTSALSFGGVAGSYLTITEKFNGSSWTTNASWNLNTARYRLAGCGTQSSALSFGGGTGSYLATTEKFTTGTSVDYNIYSTGTSKYSVDYTIDFNSSPTLLGVVQS